MISADSLSDVDLDYPVSLRRARRAPHEGARPDPSGFEATSRQRLMRAQRHRRRGSAGSARNGIHLRGSTLALELRL